MAEFRKRSCCNFQESFLLKCRTENLAKQWIFSTDVFTKTLGKVIFLNILVLFS